MAAQRHGQTPVYPFRYYLRDAGILTAYILEREEVLAKFRSKKSPAACQSAAGLRF